MTELAAASHARPVLVEVPAVVEPVDAVAPVPAGSIDPAFKRRMSLRLQFPFPDVDMRQRLWATHIPTDAPVAGDFDFAELARRFPLSGGYIRNSTLRAAFLAAQERRPLGQQHLLRAITLEYRELGKLATGGGME
jgi:SpoVK/Ycf46/Vps4 family AAA+-type ATPase